MIAFFLVGAVAGVIGHHVYMNVWSNKPVNAPDTPEKK